MNRLVILASLALAMLPLAAAVPPDIQALLDNMSAKPPIMRIEAARALVAKSPDASEFVPTLVAAMKDDYFDVRESAAELLRRCGPAAVPALATSLTDPHYYGRYYAARTLGRLGVDARPAVPALAKALGDPAIDVRVEAALALDATGECRPAAKALGHTLQDPNDMVRAAAARALGQTGDAAIAEIIEALKHPDAGVRGAAFSALTAIGPAGKAAAPVLIDAFHAEIASLEAAAKTKGDGGMRDSFLRHYLSDAPLSSAMPMMGDAVVPDLIALLQTGEDVRVRWCTMILGRIGPDAKAAVPALAAAMATEKDPGNRARLAGTLGAVGVGVPEALPALAAGLRDKDEVVRRFSAQSLAKLSAVETLTIALKDKDPIVRKLAEDTLVAMGMKL